MSTKASSSSGRPPGPSRRAPVLACPRVMGGAPLGLGPGLAPSRLEALLDGLLEAGYRFLDVDGWLDPSPEAADRACLLSFDDGGVDFAETALPVLLARGIPCALFVSTSQVGRPASRRLGPLRLSRPQLSWEDLRRLAGHGVRAQSRAHHHVDLRGLAPEVAFGDLLRSRRELERRLGEAAPLLAYPFASVDASVADLAARAGFAAAFGRGRSSGGGSMDLPRVPLRGRTGPKALRAMLETPGKAARARA